LSATTRGTPSETASSAAIGCDSNSLRSEQPQVVLLRSPAGDPQPRIGDLAQHVRQRAHDALVVLVALEASMAVDLADPPSVHARSMIEQLLPSEAGGFDDVS
jgi:hypothetical protein